MMSVLGDIDTDGETSAVLVIPRRTPDMLNRNPETGHLLAKHGPPAHPKDLDGRCAFLSLSNSRCSFISSSVVLQQR
jgi:hypothetical protein